MTERNLTVDDGDLFKAPAVDKPDKPAPDTQAAQSDAETPEAIVDRLKAQVIQHERDKKAALETAEAERRARTEAETRAKHADDRANQATSNVRSADIHLVTTELDAADKRRELAERAYVAAMEAGDWAAAGKAQGELSTAAAEKIYLTNHKRALEAAPAEQVARSEAPQQRDPADAFLSQFSPRTQQWLRSHPDALARDHAGNVYIGPKTMARHYEALAAQVKPDSDEYFQMLDQPVAPQPVDDGADEAVVVPPVQQRRPVSAPVSREAPASHRRPSPNSVRLTPQQVEAALFSADPKKPQDQVLKEYAENLSQAMSEGVIGRTTH